MWFKYYKGYYDVRKLELELVSLGEFGLDSFERICFEQILRSG